MLNKKTQNNNQQQSPITEQLHPLQQNPKQHTGLTRAGDTLGFPYQLQEEKDTEKMTASHSMGLSRVDLTHLHPAGPALHAKPHTNPWMLKKAKASTEAMLMPTSGFTPVLLLGPKGEPLFHHAWSLGDWFFARHF